MKISHASLPRLRLAVVLGFLGMCLLIFGYFWVNMGGRLPGITSSGYTVSASVPDADNLVYDSDVMMAGVRVGKVRDLQVRDGRAQLTLKLRPEVVPVHEGATLRVRAKTLVEESYLELVDGNGSAVPSGGSLPAEAGLASVQLNDVLATLDDETRTSLGAVLRSLDTGVSGRRADIDRVMSGLGALGREGHDALDAVAAQAEDLQALTRQTTTLLTALDTRQGQIATLVENADRLTRATADGRADIEAAVRKLPDVLGNARSATTSLSDLSTALGPVSADLNAAAPGLSKALEQLPATSRDLRTLLPALDGTLAAAPATLTRVPAVAADARSIIPSVRVALADLNPMLAYLQPYGRDVAGFFTNVAAALSQRDVNGHYGRLFTIFNEQSLRNLPINTNTGVFDKSNAYPRPGQGANPGPFTGTYPRVERDQP